MKIETRQDGHKRLLASVGDKKCPLGCIYCFVDIENYKFLPRIDLPSAEEILQKTATDVDVIQPACDVEFFLHPNALSILKALVQYGKPISFATKSKISENTAKALGELNSLLINKGGILQIAISLTRLRNWQELEKFTPSPMERIETLKMLYSQGIPTILALRPLLPILEEDEIHEIVELTYQYCQGYLAGPTYMTPALKEYLKNNNYEFSTIFLKVDWMLDSPIVETIRSERLEAVLKECAARKGLPLFEDNLSAIMYLIQQHRL